MKIIVLHGEDTNKSYSRLKKFVETAKERSWEVTYLDSTNLGLNEVLSGTSLFETERFFILRDVKKIGKKDLKWLEEKSAEISGNLIIYHGDTLSATLIKSLPKTASVEEFKLPKIIWNLMDSVFPGNGRKILSDLHKVIETDPPEWVFSLLAKQMRNLYWIKTDPNRQTIKFSGWQESKLKTQAAKFTLAQITTILEEMARIDIEVKTSKTELVSSIDLMVIKHLQ